MGGAGVAGWSLGGHARLFAAQEEPTTLQITTCESDGSIQDDHIWINGVLEPLPYTLNNGDQVSCYDPGGPVTDEPVITSFEIESTDPTADPNEPEFEYSNDGFEIDLTILELFEENYDPETGGAQNEQPYEIEDPNGGSIGING